MKHMKTLFIISIISLLIVACSNPVETTDREPYIIGIVTEIESDEILVEEDTTVNDPSKVGGKKIRFFISDETDLYMQGESGSLNEISNLDLVLSHKIKAWVRGDIAESYPAQAEAALIILLPQ